MRGSTPATPTTTASGSRLTAASPSATQTTPAPSCPSNGITQAFDVPCFCMKDTPAGPFRWKARFAPPRPTAAARYWEMTSRAVVWHVAGGDTPTNIDGFNRLAVPGAAGDLTAYYHYWGYNDFTDPRRRSR